MPLTPERDKRRLDLLKRLEELAHESDQEGSHIEADYALLEYIDDPEIKAAFDKIDKWYA